LRGGGVTKTEERNCRKTASCLTLETADPKGGKKGEDKGVGVRNQKKGKTLLKQRKRQKTTGQDQKHTNATKKPLSREEKRGKGLVICAKGTAPLSCERGVASQWALKTGEVLRGGPRKKGRGLGIKLNLSSAGKKLKHGDSTRPQ